MNLVTQHDVQNMVKLAIKFSHMNILKFFVEELKVPLNSF